MLGFSPRCSRRRRIPASTRASDENGGVLTCPRSQTSGLSFRLIGRNICHIRHTHQSHATITATLQHNERGS